jgi:hypothetical protein
MPSKKRSVRKGSTKPKRDGKALENLVEAIERLAQPEGWCVEVRRKLYGKKKQRAEFDIIVTGKAGTGEFKWLIECRDRPAEGAAPGAWILELSSKKSVNGFHKVTAVSTTGFSEGAIEYAEKLGVELRSVKSTGPEIFSWIKGAHCVLQENQNSFLTRIELRFIEGPTPENTELVAFMNKNPRCLQCSVTGKLFDPNGAFLRAVVNADKREHYFDKLSAEGRREVRIIERYSPETHYSIEGPHGRVVIPEILFEGYLTKDSCARPLQAASQYEGSDGKVIAQSCFYDVQPIPNVSMTLEFHHLADSGKTHVMLRRTT